MRRLMIVLRDIYYNRRMSWKTIKPVAESETKTMSKTDMRILTYIVIVILLTALFTIYSVQMEKDIETLTEQNAGLQTDIDKLQKPNSGYETEIGELSTQGQELQAQLVGKQDKPKSGRGGERLTSLGTYTITAYCSCSKCCGEFAKNRPGGIVYGAADIELTAGVSVAGWLPIGTHIRIDGHEYVVQDRTAEWIKDKYNGKIIDIYFADHAAAWEFGKQEKEVWVAE